MNIRRKNSKRITRAMKEIRKISRFRSKTLGRD
jgi:hypothetical protein